MEKLIEYINEYLLPKKEQNDILQSNLNSITNVIKNSSKLSLKEVRQGGSFEKGTMLKHKPEADIVMVFNKLTNNMDG